MKLNLDYEIFSDEGPVGYIVLMALGLLLIGLGIYVLILVS